MLRRFGLFALALLVFLGWLGKRDVTTSHEARVAQTARVMAAAGWPWAAQHVQAAELSVRVDPDGAYAAGRFDLPPISVNPWLVPVLNDQIRVQKPPLPNWCAAVLYRLLGVSEFATRLVPALLAALAMLLLADLAGLLLGRAAALPAGLVWVSTIAVVSEFREATPDPYLAFFTLSAAWGWTRASMTRARKRTLLLVFYASLGLGVLTKGPFILVHAAIALISFGLSYQRRPRSRWRTHVAGTMLMLAIALPWPLYIATHVEQATRLWQMEITRGGWGDAGEVLRNAWRYLPRTVELTLPWTPFWLAGIASALRGRSRRRRRRSLPLVWCGLTVAAFSLSLEKKTAYLLPMLPAQTLLITTGILTVAAGLRRKPALPWPRVMIIAQGTCGIAANVAGVVISAKFGSVRDVLIAGCIGIIAMALVVAATRRARGQPRRWWSPQAVGCALACLAIVAIGRTARENTRSARSFATLVAARLLPPASVLVPDIPEEAAFYLPLGMRYDPRTTQLYSIAEAPRHGMFNLTPQPSHLSHGRIIRAEIVPLPGQASEARWRLVRIVIDPPTNPASPATLSSDPQQRHDIRTSPTAAE